MQVPLCVPHGGGESAHLRTRKRRETGPRQRDECSGEGGVEGRGGEGRERERERGEGERGGGERE